MYPMVSETYPPSLHQGFGSCWWRTIENLQVNYARLWKVVMSCLFLVSGILTSKQQELWAWIGLNAVSKSDSSINWKSSYVSTPMDCNNSSKISFVASGRLGKTSVMAVRRNVVSKSVNTLFLWSLDSLQIVNHEQQNQVSGVHSASVVRNAARRLPQLYSRARQIERALSQTISVKWLLPQESDSRLVIGQGRTEFEIQTQTLIYAKAYILNRNTSQK